ncbi:MAG: ATP-binding protein [Thermodesulfobacteriota bacterium]|nr:ATP-binding protein [Thermodesulfobacteriota bacterium]
MVLRKKYINEIDAATRRAPVVSLLGPRQCGKTTLVRLFGDKHGTTYFDLESIPDQRRLQNPELMLGSLKGLVILDEIQIMPELFSVLRVLVDRPDNQTKFLILGSASPHIIKNVSETLAGRTEFIELSGFNVEETGKESLEKLWLRGGFPLSFLAGSNQDSLAWRENFIRTFLERDIPQLGISIPAQAMRRFWTMLAHYHGQTLNASELGRSMGLSDKTIKSYLDILTGTFMVRQLQPWFENISKRQVKAPKIYFRDSGILHSLLDIPHHHHLMGHPRLGASWEGFALEQILQIVGSTEPYFWATHSGAEVDLFFSKGGKRYGVEFKFNEAPKISKSMHIVVADLGLSHLYVIYPGKESYPVAENISVVSLADAGNGNNFFQDK